jgi:predicted RNA-binding Zn-ribbon protein involved in translation (DUF1610 family)
VKKAIELLEKTRELVRGFMVVENLEKYEELCLLLDSIKAELRKGVLADASSRYYNVKCEKCGWYGSTEFVDGGGQIADTGDYNDIFCPACGSVDLEDLEEPKTQLDRENPEPVQVLNHVIYEITEALELLDIKPCPDRDIGNVIEYNLEDGIDRLRNLICAMWEPEGGERQ